MVFVGVINLVVILRADESLVGVIEWSQELVVISAAV